MKRNKLLYFFAACGLSVMCLLGGCGTNNSDTTTNNDTNTTKTENDAKKAGEDVKDGVEDVGKDIVYSAKNVKDDIVNAGYELKDAVTPDKYNYFSGTETSYTYNDAPVIVYEFNSKEELDNALKNITDNGMTIKGASANFKSTPYYYTKGNTLIIYEGNDNTYVDKLNTMYTPYKVS